MKKCEKGFTYVSTSTLSVSGTRSYMRVRSYTCTCTCTCRRYYHPQGSPYGSTPLTSFLFLTKFLTGDCPQMCSRWPQTRRCTARTRCLLATIVRRSYLSPYVTGRRYPLYATRPNYSPNATLATVGKKVSTARFCGRTHYLSPTDYGE